MLAEQLELCRFRVVKMRFRPTDLTMTVMAGVAKSSTVIVVEPVTRYALCGGFLVPVSHVAGFAGDFNMFVAQ